MMFKTNILPLDYYLIAEGDHVFIFIMPLGSYGQGLKVRAYYVIVHNYAAILTHHENSRELTRCGYESD